MPTIKEMLEYLMDHNFMQDQEITILVGDPEKRLVWHPTKLIGITDQNRPIILLEVGEPEDMDGEEVVPVKYDNVWNFFGKNRKSTIVENDGSRCSVKFSDLPGSVYYIAEKYGKIYCAGYDDYGTHYGEYAGSYAQDVIRYSDDVINDAFEGDPDAYWNID